MDPIVGGLGVMKTPHHRENSSAFSHRVVADFENAMVEARNGLYGIPVVQVRGEHHRGLAAEFRHRLVSLVEECFAPDKETEPALSMGLTGH